MRSRVSPVLCVVFSIVAFVIDLLTPQLFVAAILLDAPIVLSSLIGSRRFTYGLMLASLAMNVIAGYVNGIVDHHHWNAAGIANRALAALSIVFVGYLGTAVQESAQRAGRLEAQRQRVARESLLGSSLERIRTLISLDLVLRAIAHEATVLFDAQTARFVLTDRSNGITLVADRDSDTIDVDESRLSPEAASLVARTLGSGDVGVVQRTDAFGRLVLDHLDAPVALALPIVERERRFGVVLVLGRTAESFDDALVLARAFAAQAAGALAQARVFAQLADRNAALEERSAVIRDLVYALSHDLRTPLAALGMTMRQAANGAYGTLPESYRAILTRSIVATDDVQRLAETLLLVARFESHDRRPDRERVDLGDLARQITGELDALARDSDVALRLEVNDAVTIGDRGDLRRAIVNLVANALQHTPQGGTVTVGVRATGNLATVCVEDDGFGVSESARANLFTRFARGEGRRGGGSGLGLYIVRRVAEESGGSVAYEPRAPRGSRFTLTLPLVS